MKHPLVHFGLLMVLLSCGLPAVCARLLETDRIAVDCGRDAGAFKHCWPMTGLDLVQLGFAPDDAGGIQGSDQRQQLIHARSILQGGTTYGRIHNLLCMVSVDRWGTLSPRHNCSGLNQLLSFVVNRGFKPFFELMAVPREVADDPGP